MMVCGWTCFRCENDNPFFEHECWCCGIKCGDDDKWEHTEEHRKAAIKIMEIFEEFLDRKDITIPSEDREGNPEEARIYGCEYYELEDKITEILTPWKIQ